MKNNPGFSAATITILALAIGVNGMFFSVCSNYLLKPLPIRGAERHFSVAGFNRNNNSAPGWSRAEVEALRRSAGHNVEGLYVSDTFQALALAPVQRQTMITSVSGNYFHLLGGTASLGRTLREAEEHEPVAVRGGPLLSRSRRSHRREATRPDDCLNGHRRDAAGLHGRRSRGA
jgi:hypothetical protein